MIHLDEKFIYQDASGDVVTFNTNTEHSFRKIEVSIDPTQDLHGYDRPWVGGDGKNLVELESSYADRYGVSYTPNPATGEVVVNGTATNQANCLFKSISITEGTNVYVSGTPSDGGASNYCIRIVYRDSGNTAIRYNGSLQTDIPYEGLVMTAPEGTVLMEVYGRVVSGGTASNVVMKPFATISDTAVPFEPYANICPIDGYTGYNLIRTGLNVWDEDWETGSINTNGNNATSSTRIRTKNYIPCVSGTVYYARTGGKTLGMRFYDANKVFCGSGSNTIVADSTFATPGNAKYFRFSVVDTTTYSNDICINISNPSTNGTYEPYQGEVTYEPYTSTICEGLLNPLTGELTIGWKLVTVNDIYWRYSTSNLRFYGDVDIPIRKTGTMRTTPLYCSAFVPVVNGESQSATPNNSIYANGTSERIYIQNTQYTTESAFKTAYGDVQILYPLDTPITYQLTPQEIKTLVGQNTVWADGGTVSCEYPESRGNPYLNYFDDIRNNMPQHIRVTFVPDNMVFEDKDLTDKCQITSFMNPDIDMTFGTAFSSEVSLSFIQTQKTNQVNWAHEFRVELGIENNGETDWTLIGIFSGKRPLRNSNGVINMVAYDRMQRFNRPASDFIDMVNYPCTLQELYDELCAFVMVESVQGDEIAEVMSRTVSTMLDKALISTCRDLLFLIAEANGCYARITPDGYLQFKWFENHRNDFTLERDYIFDFESTNLQQFDGKTWRDLSGYTWKQLRLFKWKEFFNRVVPFFISRILVKWEETETIPKKEVLHPPEGEQPVPLTWNDADLLTWDQFDEYIWDEAEGHELSGVIYEIHENPFINYSTEEEIRAHLQLIINRIKGFNTYYVAAVSAVGNWVIEAGDVINLELNDDTVSYPIFSRTLYWNGSCRCDYESTGNIARNEE